MAAVTDTNIRKYFLHVLGQQFQCMLMAWTSSGQPTVGPCLEWAQVKEQRTSASYRSSQPSPCSRQAAAGLRDQDSTSTCGLQLLASDPFSNLSPSVFFLLLLCMSVFYSPILLHTTLTFPSVSSSSSTHRTAQHHWYHTPHECTAYIMTQLENMVGQRMYPVRIRGATEFELRAYIFFFHIKFSKVHNFRLRVLITAVLAAFTCWSPSQRSLQM